MNFRVYLINCKIDKFYQEAMREYKKRLSRYCRMQTVSVKKAEELAANLPGKGYRIIISNKGRLISSEELAEKINQLAISGHSEVAFIIGAEHLPGDEVMALSPMEMDPGLQATIIFEQVYRAYRILHNEPYHK